jgi:hypothetical protein
MNDLLIHEFGARWSQPRRDDPTGVPQRAGRLAGLPVHSAGEVRLRARRQVFAKAA